MSYEEDTRHMRRIHVILIGVLKQLHTVAYHGILVV
jgi:hypothetical protein